MPTLPRRFVNDIPTGCLTMTREMFDRFGPFLSGTFSSDSVFNWRAAAAGVRPWFEPSLQVTHLSKIRVRELIVGRYVRGCTYALQRVQHETWPYIRRIVYAVLFPAVSLLLMTRILRRVLPRQSCRRAFAPAAILVFLGVIAWSAGEAAGYLSSMTARRQAVPEPSPTDEPLLDIAINGGRG